MKSVSSWLPGCGMLRLFVVLALLQPLHAAAQEAAPSGSFLRFNVVPEGGTEIRNAWIATLDATLRDMTVGLDGAVTELADSADRHQVWIDGGFGSSGERAGAVALLELFHDDAERLPWQVLGRDGVGTARRWMNAPNSRDKLTLCKDEEILDTLGFWCAHRAARGRWATVRWSGDDADPPAWLLLREHDRRDFVEVDSDRILRGFIVRDPASVTSIAGRDTFIELTETFRIRRPLRVLALDLGDPYELAEALFPRIAGHDAAVFVPLEGLGRNRAVPPFPVREAAILYRRPPVAQKPIVLSVDLSNAEQAAVANCADGHSGDACRRGGGGALDSPTGRMLEALLPTGMDSYAAYAAPGWLYDRLKSVGWEPTYRTLSENEGLLRATSRGDVWNKLPGVDTDTHKVVDLSRSEALKQMFGKPCGENAPESCGVSSATSVAESGLRLSSEQRGVCLARVGDGFESLNSGAAVAETLRAERDEATRFVLFDRTGRGRYIADRETTIDNWIDYLDTMQEDVACRATFIDDDAGLASWIQPKEDTVPCGPAGPAPSDDSDLERARRDLHASFYQAMKEEPEDGTLDYDGFMERCLNNERPTGSDRGMCNLRRFLLLRVVQRYDENADPEEFVAAQVGVKTDDCGSAAYGKFSPDRRASALCTALRQYWSSAHGGVRVSDVDFEDWPIVLTTPDDAARYAKWVGTGDACAPESLRLPFRDEMTRLTASRRESFETLLSATAASKFANRFTTDRALSLGSGLPAIGADTDQPLGEKTVHGLSGGVREWVGNAETYGFPAHAWKSGECPDEQRCTWPLKANRYLNTSKNGQGDPVTGFRLIFVPPEKEADPQ